MTTIAQAPSVLRDAPAGLRPAAAPQDDERLCNSSKSYVILRRSRSDRLEGRTAFRLAVLLLVALALAGCGKKGMPQPPPDEPNTYPRTYPSG